jgi:hypothetical protein
MSVHPPIVAALLTRANKRRSFNREEQSAGGRNAQSEVGSDSGRHQALGAGRATSTFSFSAPCEVAHLVQYTAIRSYSSARASSIGRTTRPSAFAILRLAGLNVLKKARRAASATRAECPCASPSRRRALASARSRSLKWRFRNTCLRKRASVHK